MEDNNILPLDIVATPENKTIIKIIGVGGGGQNAAAHMYNTGITDVTYLAINSDKQALGDCPIQDQLQIGPDGLGCGADPEKGKQYAIDSEDQIKAMLDDGTKMVFITAGMGGGTGTGASPEVARIAREMGILTVGIVTIPFMFEGPKKVVKAYNGISRIKPHCDALLIVNNTKLIKLYEDDTFSAAFKKADNVLADAAKSISDIINKDGKINVDFRDVETTLKDGGVALISSGIGKGENRMQEAIDEAVKSPLLQESGIGASKKLLFVIGMSSEHEANMREMGRLNEFVGNFSNKDDIDVIWGSYYDDSLGEDLKFTILASGFGFANGNIISTKQPTESQPADVDSASIAETVTSDTVATVEPDKADEAKKEQESEKTPEPVQEQEPEDAPEPVKPKEPVKSKEQVKTPETVQEQKPENAPEPVKTQEQAPAKTETHAAATPTSTQVEPTPGQTVPVQPVTPNPVEVSSQIQAEQAIAALYGDGELTAKNLADSRKNYLIFDDKELSNPDIADMLENTPAYKRKQDGLQRVKTAKTLVLQETLF